MYFFYYGKKIVITNGFIKKTQKTPIKEIQLAKKKTCRVYFKGGKQNMKYETLEEYTQKRMKNKNFAKEYEAIQPEMNIIRAIIDARTSRNLTQQELAELTGIDQATISKLENGTRNPSVKLLEKLAKGMNTNLKIEFVPR
jgi:DNA-binding XRE family transcriptional regulator